ncbi:MAG: cupin domain-containing protein [Methanobrevibacter thaueri]|jgi:mannose-6-phosphate isomerase-like protein (cupin superfamily)|uniref:cupin domain-containing protein n=1 Tax=Methanobrevibacter thaueri TaxID=190975 RepID=UPI0026EBB3B5|nr:cupin domain-containing protein [Methanobrevibacter thaueri]MBE6495464.1 cupin domain-containing protein [Methanobrevibacter thaueri]
MIIDFNELKEISVPKMNGGDGEVIAKMQVNEVGRFVESIIPPGSSIGPHIQESNHDINYIVSGEGIALCDGVKEDLKPGVCHVCPRGSSHSIINTGDDDLVFFTFVPQI